MELSPAEACTANKAQANKVRDELLRQGERLYSEDQQTEKMMDQRPKEPSHSSQDSGFFYTKRRRGVAGCCKVLGVGIFVLTAVHVGQVTMSYKPPTRQMLFSVLQL